MCELVFLVIPILQGDENAQIMCSSYHSYACTSELRAKLIVAPRANTFLGAVDIEGRHGRVVGGLFGDVRDGDGLVLAFDTSGTA